jgi:hypothetical protein
LAYFYLIVAFLNFPSFFFAQVIRVHFPNFLRDLCKCRVICFSRSLYSGLYVFTVRRFCNSLLQLLKLPRAARRNALLIIH